MGDVDALHPVSVQESLGFVAQTVRLVCKEFDNEAPVIGFAGAPFTVASYAIEGGGSRNYVATKSLMYRDPADVASLHGSWSRNLPRPTLTCRSMRARTPCNSSIVGSARFRRTTTAITFFRIQQSDRRDCAGHARDSFRNDDRRLLTDMRDAGGDVIGLDWRVELDEGVGTVGRRRRRSGKSRSRLALCNAGEDARSGVRDILRRAGGKPGHIFNLGHGILPETPVDNVLALIDAVHECSAR